MWDMKTGRSRGYGFVAFRERADAEKALSSMDGEWLGSRAIRCNWANQKGQPSIHQQQAMQQMGMTPTTPYGHHHFPTHGIHSYDMVVNQTPAWQTTCYVGNLTPYTTQNDLVPLFQNFGYVVECRMQADRGFAFIKMDSHENAAMAICQLNGYMVNGRPLKCSVCFYPLSSLEYMLLTGRSGARIVTPTTISSLTPTTSTARRAPRPLATLVLRALIPTINMVVSVQVSVCLSALANECLGAYGPPGQQSGYAGPQAQSPAGYGPQMGYNGPPSAGGYGRGQGPAAPWSQPPPAQNFNSGFAGYQG